MVRLRVKFVAAFASAVLVLLVAWVAIEAMARAAEAQRGLRHAASVRAMARDVLQGVVDAETGQRGYLLTGDRQYLDAYTRGRELAARQLGELGRVGLASARSQLQLAAIEPILAAKLDEMASTIAMYDRGRHADAIALVRQDVGKGLMDELRERVGALRGEEELLVDARSRTFAAQMTAARWLLGVGAVLAFVLAVLVNLSIRRDVRALERASEVIQGQSRELEQRSRALEQSNRELDQFAYVASHDLKAPLRGISSLAQWIGDDAEGRLDAQGREHLRLLQGRVKRLEGLIDGILEYSRAGRSGAHAELVDVRRLVRDTVDLLAPGEHVTVEVGEELPRLMTPRAPMQQVWMNLIGNALKHGRREQAVVRVGSQREGHERVYFVADNGPGIEPQFREKVFGIFQTLAPRDRVESTGIGLAVVKKLIEQRGGRVWLESPTGEGVTCYFTWPQAPEVAGVSRAGG